MYFVYSLLLTLGFILLLPRFLFDALHHGKYVAGFRERLGQLPQLANAGRPRIWIHCVSVGETQAARPLVTALRERFPSHGILVSTTTLTGQRLARDVFRDEADAVFYFPFDWAWTTRRALTKLDPATVLLMETELWPRLLLECRKRNIPLSMVNGRISDTSYRRYKWVAPFVARVVNNLDLALMQSEEDAVRIRALGLSSDRVVVTGNLKFDQIEDAAELQLTSDLRARFHFDEGPDLIVAASTHAPEERLLIEAYQQIRKANSGGKGVRLLLAPRHPERFSEVGGLLNESGLTWTRRSSAPSQTDGTCEVVLLDTVGELRAVYSLASIVFVGGSIAPAGGHNVLEPAVNGVCIVTGAHTSNFAAVISAFVADQAIVQLPDLSSDEMPVQLAREFTELLSDTARRREIGMRAQALCERNRGATSRTVTLLSSLLSPPDRIPRNRAYETQPALISK
ncbi:MAG: 3-deoxy-D-manno-octulosonic acid transferase [Pyrinomonadaceae bacterium]